MGGQGEHQVGGQGESQVGSRGDLCLTMTQSVSLHNVLTDVAECVFDRCLSYGQEKNPERPAYEITFNYEFLDDTYMAWIHEDYRKRMRSDDTTSMSDSSSMGKTSRWTPSCLFDFSSIFIDFVWRQAWICDQCFSSQ